jgi:tRNA 2-thiouridine synthesizing protein B
MSDLHTVNKSPFERDSMGTCLSMALPGSSILLLEDGVYAALKGTAMADKMTAAMADRKMYAMEPDLKARGIDASRLLDGIELVDYAGFVDLVTSHDKVQAWL